MPWKDKDKVRAKCRAYYQKHKAAWPKYGLKKRYGLTPEQVEAQRDKQKGLCAICEEPKKLVVDHCHNSLKFRGLLCMNCNTLLGMAEDNIKVLKSAVKYLSVEA